jgi:hypothetical protein
MWKWVCLSAFLALCIPISLSASTKTYKKGFTVVDPVQVQNVTLSPGHYEVTWMRMGSNVPVTILQHSKAIVTVPAASVVEQKTPYDGGALMLTKEPNGAEELTKIEFSKVAVILPPASPTVR